MFSNHPQSDSVQQESLPRKPIDYSKRLSKSYLDSVGRDNIDKLVLLLEVEKLSIKNKQFTVEAALLLALDGVAEQGLGGLDHVDIVGRIGTISDDQLSQRVTTAQTYLKLYFEKDPNGTSSVRRPLVEEISAGIKKKKFYKITDLGREKVQNAKKLILPINSGTNIANDSMQGVTNTTTTTTSKTPVFLVGSGQVSYPIASVYLVNPPRFRPSPGQIQVIPPEVYRSPMIQNTVFAQQDDQSTLGKRKATCLKAILNEEDVEPNSSLNLKY